jgi:AraC-like DNA-binding protein
MGVSVVLVRVLVDAVERAGASREHLFAATGIDVDRLASVHGRFELHEFAAFQTQALNITGDAALGLHMAEHATEASFDLMAPLVSHAPTLREALNLSLRFQPLLLEDGQLFLSETGSVAGVRFEFTRSSELADRMLAEFMAAAVLRLIRMVAARGTVKAASFEHERPAHYREYARMFGGVERFGQHTTSIEFDRSLLDQPMTHQHSEFHSLLRTEAERLLARAAGSLPISDALQRYLLARPASKIPDLATAARDLGLSTRSLRRHLAANGTSYRTLVRATLEISAGRMLRDPRCSIQETAHALGFSDASTFHRAFKRWTGMTPKQYREPAVGKRSDADVPGLG